MSAALKQRMTADEFLAWTLTLGDDTRYELLDGEPLAMAPERIDHALMKFRIARLLADEVDRRHLPSSVLVDGVGVRVDPRTMFIPDILVRCGGDPVDPGKREVNDPTILVEVLSPSTKHIDLAQKFIGYFTLQSLRHYLIVSVADRTVLHHHRRDDGMIESRTLAHEPIVLAPPGLVLNGLFPPQTG